MSPVVAKRMNVMGLKAIAKRKFKVTTDSEHNKPVFDNILIGLAMDKRINKELVWKALMMALFKCKYPKDVIVHSDRGPSIFVCPISHKNLKLCTGNTAQFLS